MHVKNSPNARILKNATVFDTCLVRALLIAVAFFMTSSVAQARVRWVGASSGCDSATIQDAINRASNGDEVRITKDGGYQGEWHGQALSINNKSLTIGGNWDYCGQPDAQYPVGYQVVSGYDNPSSPNPAPVITIRGTSNVNLYGLLISLGDPSSAIRLGGGIDFRGNGSLFLRTVILQYNVSSYGGGAIRIDCVSGCNSPATLTLLDNVYIYDNTAYYGGGVYLGYLSKLIMKNAYTLFHRNHAIIQPDGTSGKGGAIFMGSAAAADIGSPHPGNVAGVFYQNSAADAGGAIYVDNVGDDSIPHPTINLYSTSATEPLSFIENQAPHGAAVTVKSQSSATVGKEVCATHAYFHGNRSTEVVGQLGSIVLASGPGAGFSVNSDDCLYQLPPDAAACGRMDETRCDQFSGNDTGQGNVFDAQYGGKIFLRRAYLTSNSTASTGTYSPSLLRVTSPPPYPTSIIRVEDSVLTGNMFSDFLARVDTSNAAIFMRHVTIARNNARVFGGRSIFRNQGGLIDVSNSIIDMEADFSLAAESGGTTMMDFVLASNALGYSQAGTDPDLFIGTPSYLPGFYRLQPYSQGIDRAMVAADNAAEFDSDGTRRNVDNTGINNIPGYFADLGAYESTATSIPPVLDTIFASSFESLAIPPQSQGLSRRQRLVASRHGRD